MGIKDKHFTIGFAFIVLHFCVYLLLPPCCIVCCNTVLILFGKNIVIYLIVFFSYWLQHFINNSRSLKTTSKHPHGASSLLKLVFPTDLNATKRHFSGWAPSKSHVIAVSTWQCDQNINMSAAAQWVQLLFLTENSEHELILGSDIEQGSVSFSSHEDVFRYKYVITLSRDIV